MILIDNKYRIDADETQYIAQYRCAKKKPDSPEKWALVGYYSDLPNAINAVKDYELRRRLGTDVYTLKQALEEYADITAEFTALLK